AQATDACLACSDAHEQEVFARLAVTKVDAHLRASTELAEKQAFHTQVEAHLQELVAEQKAMDKNFKKEFADAEPFYSKILHLYRSRFANSSLVAASTSEMPAERPRNSRQLSHINSNSRQSDIAGSEQLQAVH
ncbi:WD_REPEATS_REGION domain-containing protein, partial [Haematococcus lacustris]